MGFLSKAARKIVFWTYPRTSWQWDVLCVLILVFIFLTPKSWFDRSHGVKTIPLAAEVLGTPTDNAEVERRVRALTGRADAIVTAVRPRVDENGRVVGYEVDIR